MAEIVDNTAILKIVRSFFPFKSRSRNFLVGSLFGSGKYGVQAWSSKYRRQDIFTVLEVGPDISEVMQMHVVQPCKIFYLIMSNSLAGE